MSQYNSGSLVEPQIPSGESWDLFPDEVSENPTTTDLLLHLTGEVIRGKTSLEEHYKKRLNGLAPNAIACAYALIDALTNSDALTDDFLGIMPGVDNGVKFIKADNMEEVIGKKPESLTDGSRTTMKTAIVRFLTNLDYFFNGSLFYKNNPLGTIHQGVSKIYKYRALYAEGVDISADQLGDAFGFKPGIDIDALKAIQTLIADQTIDFEAIIKESIENMRNSHVMLCVGESGEGKSTLRQVILDGNDDEEDSTLAEVISQANGYHIDVNNNKKSISVLGLAMDKPANVLAAATNTETAYYDYLSLEMPAYEVNGRFAPGFLIHALKLPYKDGGEVPLIKGYPRNYTFSHEFIEHMIQELAPGKQVKLCYSLKTGLRKTHKLYEPLREFLLNKKEGLDGWIEHDFPTENGDEVEKYFDYFCRLMQRIPPSFVQGLYSSIIHDVPLIATPTPRNFETKRLTKNLEARYIQGYTANDDLDNSTDRTIKKNNHNELVFLIEKVLAEMGKQSEYNELYRFAESIRNKFAHHQGIQISNALLRLTFSLMVMEANYKDDERKINIGARKAKKNIKKNKRSL
jgi:hypothetical protein